MNEPNKDNNGTDSCEGFQHGHIPKYDSVAVMV